MQNTFINEKENLVPYYYKRTENLFDTQDLFPQRPAPSFFCKQKILHGFHMCYSPLHLHL